MRSHSLVLGLPLFSVFAGCTFGSDHDYQVAVTWLINGTTPDQAMCQEQGIARARFDVQSRGGKFARSIEQDCASTIKIYQDGQYVDYGGFYTARLFSWETPYDYAQSLVDASGIDISEVVRDSFELRFNEADVYQLGYLDYVQPHGSVAALYGEWSVGTGDLAANCASERLVKVQIQATSALDTYFEQKELVGEERCNAGLFRSNGRALATGFYHFRYVAISEGGAEVDPGDPIEVFVDGASDVTLRRETFLDGK